MSRIRAEQIQDLTLRDQNISETANIDQSKIEDWQSDAAGWLSQGIVKAVPHTFFTNDGAQAFDDFWDGTQAGQLYFDVGTDELYIGTAADPFYNLVAGYGTDPISNGWDNDIIVQMGTEAVDYSGDQPAQVVGNIDMSSGYDWATTPQDFRIDVNNTGEFTINLTVLTTDLTTTISEINNAISNAGVVGVEAFSSNNMYVGIRTTTKGSDQILKLLNGTNNALNTLGITSDEYYGTDGTNLGTTFDLGIDLASTGTNFLVYLNGALMENATNGDYQVVDLQTIQFNYDTYGEDKITAIVYNDASFTNYATKIYVDNLFYSESGHDHDGVSTPKLNFNESMEVTTDIDGVSGNTGVLINHNLVPTVDTRNLGSTANPWGNIYANEGHFSASSIYIDNAILRFNTTDASLEFSDNAGATYQKVAPSQVPGAPTTISSDTGQPITLTSDTGIEIVGDILPDVASTRNIGSALLPFNEIHTDELFVSASSLYVNGKKVLQDVSNTMTISTDPDQAIKIETLYNSARGNANITFASANNYSVEAVGDLTFTANTILNDKDIAFTNNSANGRITFDANGESSTGALVTYSNIEPGTNGDLHIGAEGKAFNDVFVNTILFRPLAEAEDYAKIDSTTDGLNTIIKHQIGATLDDKIVFQSNNGTTITDIMTINGIGDISINNRLSTDGTFIGTLDGNAATATKLKTARTISVSGGVTGSATFDGSANATITTTVANDSHTHDTRYYTETEIDTNFLNKSNTGEETMQGSLIVQGNLTVSGTTTTVNTETIQLADNIITLNSNYTGSTPSEDSGIEVERGTQTNYQFMFDEATDTFVIGMVGDLQSVSTRETTPTTSGIPFWNNTSNRFDTTSTLVNVSVSNVPTDTLGAVTTGNELITDVLHTQGNGAGQMYISGSNIDANSVINVGKGIAGGQTAQNVEFGGTVTAPTFSGSLSGNATSASTATKLTTARTIDITGDIAATAASFDGTANVAMSSSTVNSIQGVSFYTGTTAPTATTRLNMDGYFYATRVYNAVYNDLAEFMPKAEDAEAGDVVIMTENGLAPSKERLDGAVVGVYSDSFGYALGAEDAENKIPVAISGRVWVKIAEPCKIGDLLVSGKRGKASVRKSGEDVLGKVIGKVMKNKTDYEEERIEMLVMNG